MSRVRVRFCCQECGFESLKWLGRCPSCESWNSFVEEPLPAKKGAAGSGNLQMSGQPVSISDVVTVEEIRYCTGIGELDRVLGGGIVRGSLILIGGDPGIGKSTLGLQAASAISIKTGRVLYVSGEESIHQTKLRALRLGAVSPDLYIVSETSLEGILRHIEKLQPNLVVVDSIQTVFTEEVHAAPGGVSQVRECTAHLMRLAKSTGIPVFIVGHVTKEGYLAGPRVLEHMVDTVLYFEGDRHHNFRVLRAVKNRFGSTNEIGVFEMGEHGLVPVANPSEIFLAERTPGATGSVVIPAVEGTRPVLVEVQALVSPSNFAAPRRMTKGIDHNRVSLLAAVLEKRVGLHLANQDIFVNVVGGVKLDEPAIDLGLVAAIASSLKEIPVNPQTLVVGEVGLTGEVRAVGQLEKRVKEGAKLGFKHIIAPGGNKVQSLEVNGINIIPVKSVAEVMDIILGGD
ncbi:DNA repair protein RadA [Thermincola potens]|uniref:DNA repair protein RadA n=1 Tax=Thermincola potens (strain JR) TaxID=635013 RepID=D5X9R4_THEPJ|nr:DNA repair protein RadA [Thermincola potens JR]